jgi:hypothetical protein
MLDSVYDHHPEKVEKWLVPILVENIHWKLLCLFPKANVIVIYDSSETKFVLNHTTQLDCIRVFLSQYGKKFDVGSFYNIPWLSIYSHSNLVDIEPSDSVLFILKTAQLNVWKPKELIAKIKIRKDDLDSIKEDVMKITDPQRVADDMANFMVLEYPVLPISRSRYTGIHGKGINFILDPTECYKNPDFYIVNHSRKRKMVEALTDHKWFEDTAPIIQCSIDIKNSIMWDTELPIEPIQAYMSNFCTKHITEKGLTHVYIISLLDDQSTWRDPLIFERMILESLYDRVRRVTLCLITPSSRFIPKTIVPSEDYLKDDIIFQADHLSDIVILNDSIYQLKTHLYKINFLDIVLYESTESILREPFMSESIEQLFTVYYNDDNRKNVLQSQISLNICVNLELGEVQVPSKLMKSHQINQ